MDKKHSRADDDEIQHYWNELRPPKHVKQEQSEAEDTTNPAYASTLKQLDQPVVDLDLIYPERLEAETARILVLHAGSTSDEIKCGLIQKVPLTQASPNEVLSYEALSYVWGEGKIPDFIFLCGSRYAVTRNLAEALKYLRFPNSNRMLWVDAICINQGDEEEKEVQVKLTHRIYKLAKRVIAWLGPPDEASSLAYGTMNAIQKQHITPLSTVLTFRMSNDEADDDHDPFRKLMDRPYWFRAWIVQEMMFARTLVIQCGSEVVPYSTLEKVYPRDKQAYFAISSDESEQMRFEFRGDREARILRMDSEQISSNRYLDCFLDRQCLKRHDNIFAFLNLLSDDIGRQISVCYKTEPRELIRHTAQVIIESTESLYIIVIRGRQAPPCAQGYDKWQLDMPSWCPYLAMPYECSSIEPQDSPSLFAEKACFSFVNDRLRVRGFVIGRVSRTISRHKQPGIGTAAWWDQAHIARELKHYWKCLALGLNGMPRDQHTWSKSVEATTRTLFAGRGGEEFDIQTLAESKLGNVEGPAVTALREIWNNGNARLLCSFRLGRAANRALHSSKAAPAAWINRIALVPRTVKPRDVICTILGCPMPVALRKMGKRHQILGEAYVDTKAMGPFRVTMELRDFIVA